MPLNDKSDFVLLSKLIHKLEDITYYRVFAKSLLRTASNEEALPHDNKLVKEMFTHFIKENELSINYNGSVVTTDFIESEAQRRASKKVMINEDFETTQEMERDQIWEKEIYIKVKDLKKLYANRCIVFPMSILADKDISKQHP